jgi:uncharacterized protein with PQ loop repeat
MENPTELMTWVFMTVNAARALAYLPQIFAALKCQDGARSISIVTWGYFALAHFTGAIYSLQVAHDVKLSGVFFGNCAACAALVAVVGWKRLNARPLADANRGIEGRPMKLVLDSQT